MLTKKYINTLERVHSISLEKAQPGRELWHGGDSWLHDDKVVPNDQDKLDDLMKVALQTIDRMVYFINHFLDHF